MFFGGAEESVCVNYKTEHLLVEVTGRLPGVVLDRRPS